MKQYSILEAKNNFSEICSLLINKQEDVVLITIDEKPVAQIVPYTNNKKRIAGCLKDKYKFKEDIDWFNSDITKMFNL